MRLAGDKLNELKSNVMMQIESVFTFAKKSDHIPPPTSSQTHGGGKPDDAFQGRLWMLGFQSWARREETRSPNSAIEGGTAGMAPAGIG